MILLETQRSVFATPTSSASTTERQHYYYRLARLLTEGGTKAVRNAFSYHHPPRTLAIDLRSQMTCLETLKKKKVLNERQWYQLFPRNGIPPDSEMFDLTLLLILLRNICGLHAPSSGWDGKPEKADLSLQANLVRIKRIRNEFAHMTSTGISKSHFLTIREELRTALKALGLDEGELDRLEADPFNEEIENLKTGLDELKWKMDQVIEHQEHQKTFTCVGKLVD